MTITAPHPGAADAENAVAAAALTVAELDHHGTVSHEVYTAGFYDSGWDFTVRLMLGKAARGGADIGEVLATIADIPAGDARAWFSGWLGVGTRIADIAATAAQQGHRVSAARAYLRAATYLAVATNAVAGLDDTTDLLPTFGAHRAAWEGFVAMTSWRVERVDIPYEGNSMPGWLFHPDSSTTPRPTLVINNGSDGSISGVWCAAGEGGLDRGYRVLLFDGPGQQSMFFERDIPFRPDWEKVLTPVVDYLLARPDVDPAKLAVYGISQAGYWVPRALAFEHRFAAAIADGGVVDISRTYFGRLPPALLDLYRHGNVEQFDAYMDHAMHTGGGKAAGPEWQFRTRPYGQTGYAAFLDAVSEYSINEDIAQRISTPLYIVAPDGDQLLPGQADELAALVPQATRVHFTQPEGASYHCQPLARELTEQRMFDWLDEQLSGR